MYDNIFAPWRFKYVASHSEPQECILCNARDSNDDARSYILQRTYRCFVILNLFPYNNGHLMVVPNDHVSLMSDLDSDTLKEMVELASRCEKILRNVYSPQGFNIGMNIGKCAGAGIQEHIHLHVIPRWLGDTNFMGVIASTRVIPEDIDTTYRKLKELF